MVRPLKVVTGASPVEMMQLLAVALAGEGPAILPREQRDGRADTDVSARKAHGVSSEESPPQLSMGTPADTDVSARSAPGAPESEGADPGSRAGGRGSDRGQVPQGESSGAGGRRRRAEHGGADQVSWDASASDGYRRAEHGGADRAAQSESSGVGHQRAEREAENLSSRGAPLALVVETSGSSGTPKRVMLSAAALRASARATEVALGSGQWLLALPVHYIAGLQVLNRSLLAGTDPVVLPPGPFTAEAFAASAHQLSAERRFTSLVPTQLDRLLTAAEGDAELAGLLRRFDAVLVGGQATPAALQQRATDAGVRLVRSYGSSETCGGCLYDGVPIGDTEVRVRDGRLEVSGSVLAEGYLDDPGLTASAFILDAGQRWYRTLDTATIANGVVRVTGRADDVIISGGVKVSLAAVQDVVVTMSREWPTLAGAVVVAVPSVEWGEVPVLVADGRLPGEHPSLGQVRRVVAAQLGAAAAPAALFYREEGVPMLASGKPDRQALAAAARAEAGLMSV